MSRFVDEAHRYRVNFSPIANKFDRVQVAKSQPFTNRVSERRWRQMCGIMYVWYDGRDGVLVDGLQSGGGKIGLASVSKGGCEGKVRICDIVTISEAWNRSVDFCSDQ